MNSILDRFRVMPDKQLEEAKKELANSYRGIMTSIAWKHMMEELERIYVASYKEVDQIDIKDFGVGVAAEGRGIRKGLDLLKKRIENASRQN